MPRQPEPRYLVIGRIQRPHGVRGELRMEIVTDYPEQLSRLHTLYLGKKQRSYALEGVRLHQKVALVKLLGVDDRDAADELRGELVYVAVEDAVPLEEDEHYEYELVGSNVFTEEDELLGEIVEVFTAPGANDVMVVHGPRGEVLIPLIEDVVADADLAAGRLVIRLLPGLLGDT